MNKSELIVKLNELGFTPEEYDNQLYSQGSYDGGNNDDIRKVVGDWQEVEKNEQHPIDEWGDTGRRIVIHFPSHDIFLAGHSFSGSYGRETWTNWYEVKPKQITTYEPVADGYGNLPF